MSFSLRAYAPGERHARHRDASSRISLILAGSFAEETDAGSARASAGDVIVKPMTAMHENRFGQEGARVASIVFDDDSFSRLDRDSCPWSFKRSRTALAAAIAAVDAVRAGDDNGVRSGALDIFAATMETDRARAPLWLAQLKDELETHGLRDVDVASRAEQAGAHPVHASRLFRRCFGTSITEHAQYHSVRRALGPVCAGTESLSAVAAAADYYDQSHMNRVFRRVLGRSPGVCRAMFAAAAGRAG